MCRNNILFGSDHGCACYCFLKSRQKKTFQHTRVPGIMHNAGKSVVALCCHSFCTEINLQARDSLNLGELTPFTLFSFVPIDTFVTSVNCILKLRPKYIFIPSNSIIDLTKKNKHRSRRTNYYFFKVTSYMHNKENVLRRHNGTYWLLLSSIPLTIHDGSLLGIPFCHHLWPQCLCVHMVFCLPVSMWLGCICVKKAALSGGGDGWYFPQSTFARTTYKMICSVKKQQEKIQRKTNLKGNKLGQ